MGKVIVGLTVSLPFTPTLLIGEKPNGIGIHSKYRRGGDGQKNFCMEDPDSYANNYEFQVPTKESAGDKDVTILGGANIVTQAVQTGLVDEIHMDITPILFGKGLRPFEQIEEESIQLEKMDVMETSVRTHLKFRVLK